MANVKTINQKPAIMKQMLAIVLLASIVTGCKPKNTWTKETRDAFTSNCVDNATANLGADKAKSYCDCMEGKVEKKYPKAEDVGKIDMNAMTEMAKDCMK
jgi:hypothetical protein